jgi:hypothetical protein
MDNENVPVKSEHNLRGKDGKPVTKLWYRDGRTEEIQSVPSAGSVIMAQATQAQREFKNEMDMRKEFLSLPEVKEYPVVEKQAGRVQAAMDQARKGQVNKTAVDQTLITAFNKMLDESSVVRESEYGRTASDLPFFNRIRGGYEKYVTGGAGLTDSDREVLYDMIQKFKGVADEGYNAQKQFYGELATRYGFKPENVLRLGGAVPRSQAPAKNAAAPAAQSKIGTVYTDPADGSQWIQTGADATKKENWRRK